MHCPRISSRRFSNLVSFSILKTRTVLSISGIKSEIREYQTSDLYEYLLDTVFPGIQVPVQYLAAENEILWDDEDPSQGKTIFDALVSYFKSAPEVDAAILPRGGHNYEFSQNVGFLLERRNDFVQKLVSGPDDPNAVAGNPADFVTVDTV